MIDDANTFDSEMLLCAKNNNYCASQRHEVLQASYKRIAHFSSFLHTFFFLFTHLQCIYNRSPTHIQLNLICYPLLIIVLHGELYYYQHLEASFTATC